MAGTADKDTVNPAGDGGNGEAGRITTIEDLAARQQATDSKVDDLISRIDQVLGAGQHAEAGARQASQDHVQQRLADPHHGDEIRQAIRDVNAEQAAEQAAEQQRAAHDAEHQRLRDGRQAAEQAPRDAVVSGKARLQRWMFGADR